MDESASIVPATGDTVAGVFERSTLSDALAATHRAGFGPHARVFDGARGDLAGQLRRAGFRLPLAPETDPATVLIVVTAPGRAATIAQLLARAGARAVYDARRGTAPFADAAPIPAGGAIVDLADNEADAAT